MQIGWNLPNMILGRVNQLISLFLSLAKELSFPL